MTTVPPVVELDADGAAELLAGAVARGLATRGRADVVVPGGRGLLPLLGPLAARGLPGPGWRLHLSDERLVPRGHPDRNVDAVAVLLGVAVADADGPGPGGRDAASPPVLLGPPDDGDGLPSVAGWGRLLAPVAAFDVVVLGVGTDGHTAGLFPGRPLGDGSDAPDVLAVGPAGDLPHRRVTLSARRLARTAAVLLVAVGDKGAAVAAIRTGADLDGPTGAVAGPPRYLLVAPDGVGTSRKSARV